ncbi:LytR C-terminal domain-containing protein [Nocardia cerradoensis]|uniref:LytR C-terminal domain-containing protein n=1 Tax=Nocardia cerradoensis TaxID=85688 RepID=UPI000584FFDC|nr:LytR C-terminal domain-containing protein [Nocardia cerradoensis]
MSNPNPPSGGPPLRALAMVLIALAIVFAGLGAMALSNSTSDSAAAETSSETETTAVPVTTTRAAATTPSTTAATTTAAPATTLTTTTAAPTSTAAGVDKTVPVRVLNNSTVAGLASKTGSQLTAAGFDVTETGNYPGGVIAKTTVYYGNSPHERETAQAIANELGVSAEPRFAGIADSPPGVIVIVTGN